MEKKFVLCPVKENVAIQSWLKKYEKIHFLNVTQIFENIFLIRNVCFMWGIFTKNLFKRGNIIYWTDNVWNLLISTLNFFFFVSIRFSEKCHWKKSCQKADFSSFLTKYIFGLELKSFCLHLKRDWKLRSWAFYRTFNHCKGYLTHEAMTTWSWPSVRL